MESAPYPGFVDSTRSITWRTTSVEPSMLAAVASLYLFTPLLPPTLHLALLNAFTTSIKQSNIGGIKAEKGFPLKKIERNKRWGVYLLQLNEI